ncbi:MMPL family transporter [Nakamurella lactea]|uniref:MMPL family transporter n=1 Tax=Nakamurella lactea TaxID=459515 RepID=UPI0006877FF7|nr:MMPL family transporter [Nakamurella lactea]
MVWQRFSAALVSRKGAWVTLAIGLLVVLGVLGGLAKSDPPGAVNSLPTGSESAAVEQALQQFPDSAISPVLAVVSHGDTGEVLTPADRHAAATIGAELAELAGHPAGAPVVSEDGKAAVISVGVDTSIGNSALSDQIDAMRAAAERLAPQGLTVQITGGPAFGADIAGAFSGANLTLLLVTIAIVALLLLLTYRSPILWLVPLLVVGIADQLANLLTARAGQLWNLQFDSGIVSVLVFGAGTNYALLLISRYREELRRSENHRAALLVAVRRTAPAIVASNLTVVLALLSLVFATMPSTRGLGIASAIGLLTAALIVLTVLPAALAVCGRRLFWPLVPKVAADDVTKTQQDNGFWHKVGTGVTGRPIAVVVGSVVILGVFAFGLVGSKVGLTQTEQFRVASGSAAGFQTLAEHFPAGESAPIVVVSATDQAQQVATAAGGVPGVVRAQPVGDSGTGLTKIMVIGANEPGSNAAYQLVRDVRATVAAVPDAHAIVGGSDAQSLDIENAADRDVKVVAPLVLAIVLMVLLILLRSIAAPVLLVLINAGSAVAAIGAGTFIGTHLFGFPALDVNVPLIAFLFLVALGIDYTIFLVHRAKHETEEHGTREAMVRAVTATGGVITSAGIVLAAVFAALGVLPLVLLGQLGLIVGIGVLIDTLIVRTALVPAVFALIGDRIWWPSRPTPMVPESGETDGSRVPMRLGSTTEGR